MISNPYDPADPMSVDLARYRRAVLRHAHTLRRTVHLVCSYDLGDALRFDAAFYRMVAEDLDKAAARIREAAEQLPTPTGTPR